MKKKQFVEFAVALLGVLSFLSLLGFYGALSDIGHDYASPQVWARAGQVLPDWYSPVNRCHLEWRVLQVGFLVILLFHMLLFVRFVFRQADKRQKG